MLRARNRWAVFISGTGSNLNALIDTRSDVDVALVVSTTPKAYGLVRARRAGIPTLILSNPIDWNALQDELVKFNISRIFLAGFMKIVPKTFVEKWESRMFNVHPSLLPAFPGLKSIQRAFEEKKPIGVTVHGVIPEMDAGPHVLQRKVVMGELENFEALEFCVHLSEHRLVRESVRICRREAI